MMFLQLDAFGIQNTTTNNLLQGEVKYDRNNTALQR